MVGANVCEVLRDPATPYWLRDLIVSIADRDPVDVLNALEVLADAFGEDLKGDAR